MIVISLSKCSASLRGDLTKWLLEIDTGVYVGRVTARIRDELWFKIEKNANGGSAFWSTVRRMNRALNSVR